MVVKGAVSNRKVIICRPLKVFARKEPMKVLGHIVFWILSYVVIYIALSIDYDASSVNHIITIAFHLPLLLLFYLHQLIFRYQFLRKRFITYGLCVLAIMGTSVTFCHILFHSWTESLFPDYFFVAQYSTLEVIAIHLTYIAVSFLLFLGFNWYLLRERQRNLVLEKNKIHLQALRSQLNPHFLFNSLNNIFALSQENHSMTSDYVMRLSESLRYMTYDAESEYVPLSQDLNQLGNYFELEKIRFDDNENITFKVSGDADGIPVSPLLFLPMLENAFKYLNPEAPHLECQIQVTDSQIHFSCFNSSTPKTDQSSGGLGLRNLKERLKLLYPETHRLEVTKTSTNYSIMLTLMIKS